MIVKLYNVEAGEKMTKEQAGYFAYKHTDHHVRQFNS
jgi:hypothetical protein